jgi:hypothetical protein
MTGKYTSEAPWPAGTGGILAMRSTGPGRCTGKHEHASPQELDRLAFLAGYKLMYPHDIADAMEWDVKRVRWYLAKPEVREAVEEQHEALEQDLALTLDKLRRQRGR